MNVATNLETATLYFPNRPALSCDGRETIYSEMNEGANRVATALLKMGVKAGDHVGLCAPNSPEWLVFYFGVLKAGAVAVTLSSALSPDELYMLLDHAKTNVLFTFDDRLKDIENLRGKDGITKVICPNGDNVPKAFRFRHTQLRSSIPGPFGHRGHPLHGRDNGHAERSYDHPPEYQHIGPQRCIQRTVYRTGQGHLFSSL
jgi:acyl-CoA synthetase (AMP-forming)/AMP-acid ligase II